MKGCPVPGCKEPRADHHLMCWSHWKCVPTDVQQAVRSTRAALRGCRTLRKLGEVGEEYKKAAHAAIESAARARAA